MNNPPATLLQRSVAEAIGTFALVAIGPGAAMVATTTQAFGHAGVALAFGLVIMMVVAATGHIGGAHINPSVTVALWSTRAFPSRDVPFYVAAQCTGAIAAAWLLHWLLGAAGNADATVPVVTVGRALIIEGGYTAVLGFAVARASDDTRPMNGFAPLLLGATVFAGALVTGPLTGGSFNPARSLGPAVAGGVWTSHWLYWVAPTAGMITGMHLYSLLTRRPRA